MKKTIHFFLLTIAFFSPLIVEGKTNGNKKVCRNCTPIPISASATIKDPGVYCLTQDIKGSITLEANDIELNLNGHRVDGGGAPYAIHSFQHKNLTVKNGAVINGGGLAIGFSVCDGVSIENIDVYESDRALLLWACINSEVNSLSAFNNFNTQNGIVQVDSCDTVDLFNVKVCNNIKNPEPPFPTETLLPDAPGIGLLVVNNSSNVNLTSCLVNNNERQNNVGIFAPLFVNFSENVTIVNTQVNENTTLSTVVDDKGFAPIHARSSTNLVIDGCQANGNRVDQSQSFARLIYILGTTDVEVKNCQVNDNVVGAFLPVNATPVSNDLIGIFLGSGVGVDPQSNGIISHCQVCRNQIVEAGSGRVSFDAMGSLIGIGIIGDSTVDTNLNRTAVSYCQVDSNRIESDGDFQPCAGILAQSVVDVTIDHCEAVDNKGGDSAYGIASLSTLSSVSPFDIAFCRRIAISNCSAHKMSARNFATGFYLGGLAFQPFNSCATTDSFIIDSQADFNVADLGVGFAFQNTRGCSVARCEADNNSSAGFFAGFLFDDNVTGDFFGQNTNLSISHSSAKENGGDGFHIGDGFLSVTAFSLIENCIAIANDGFGFFDNPIFFIPTAENVYLSNYTKSNGAGDYFSTGSGPFQVFSLLNGVYTWVSGDTTLTALTNIAAQ